MKLLYIGDIMGSTGRSVTADLLPGIKAEYQPDVVLAQGENVTHGRGLSLQHYEELKSLGIDGFMSGNHIFARKDILPLLADPNAPITRPANYPSGTDGKTHKFLDTPFGKVLLITLMGQIVGKDADEPTDNPLHVVDGLLNKYAAGTVTTIVNFHGDYSSEKVVIGHYLDGRVSAVIGDHWHVPTADARVLPGGTAHISDVGMVGVLNSSLGVKTEVIVKRWRGDEQGRNELEEEGELQFNGVLIDIDETTGKAHDIQQIIRHIKP